MVSEVRPGRGGGGGEPHSRPGAGIERQQRGLITLLNTAGLLLTPLQI